MGTLENLSVLAEELRGARERLEALAERAAGLGRRLRANSPTIVALDKLAHERRPAAAGVPAAQPGEGERFEGEEASLIADAWEISLINEEGK